MSSNQPWLNASPPAVVEVGVVTGVGAPPVEVVVLSSVTMEAVSPGSVPGVVVEVSSGVVALGGRVRASLWSGTIRAWTMSRLRAEPIGVQVASVSVAAFGSVVGMTFAYSFEPTTSLSLTS